MHLPFELAINSLVWSLGLPYKFYLQEMISMPKFLCHCYFNLSRLWMGLPGITLWSNYSINQFCIMFLNFNPALLNMFKETIYFCNFVLKNKRKHLSTLLNLDKFRHSVNNFNLHWVLFCWKQVQILQLEYVKIHLFALRLILEYPIAGIYQNFMLYNNYFCFTLLPAIHTTSSVS